MPLTASELDRYQRMLERLTGCAVELDENVLFGIRNLLKTDPDGTAVARGHLAAARAALTAAAASLESAQAELPNPPTLSIVA